MTPGAVLDAPPEEIRLEGLDAPRPRPTRRRVPRGAGAAGPLRAASFAALVVYGCLHWVRQVAPTQVDVAAQMAGVAVGLAALLALSARLRPGRLRQALVVGLCVAGVVAALAAAGIPVRFVGWRNWGELVAGVGEGLAALPNLNIPYRGLEEWVRWVVHAGAALLGVLAAGLAFAPGRTERPGRRLGAALALCVLYGLPVVERNPESPYVSGTVFAVLLALFLGADRVAAIGGARPRLIALAAAATALGVAALVAPRLDGGSPWIDYRGLAGDFAKRNQTSFDWNHSYSPLEWPRDGREVLRVKAKEPSYWKASVLRRFDGVRWVREEPVDATEVDTPRAPGEPDWSRDIEVTVRALRSEQYVTAGFASRISDVPRPAQPAGSGTFLAAGRPLRPGDTYTATVYTPRPTPEQLAAASTSYEDAEYVLADMTMELPEDVGGPDGGRPRPGGVQQTTFVFPFFGTPDRPTTFIPGRDAFIGGEELLERSGYARTWRAAQRIRAAAASPLDVIRRVRREVQSGTRYTERPEQGRIPLDAFLWDTKQGYCQQFSGAMALMLRMAGVPARVASGFTPGSFDSDRGEYIVRDLDAHSWVEAFFPGIGWVTFDPTPSVAPPASQDTGDGGDSASDDEADTATPRADVPAPAPAAPTPQADQGTSGGGTAPVLPLVGGGLLLALTVAGAWWWRRPHAALGPLEELQRALVRSGRPAAPGMTLQHLEATFAGTPAAQGYVRKLRLSRYAGAAEAPSRAERSALREELAAGLGALGRARAWWALPPHRPRRRDAHRTRPERP